MRTIHNINFESYFSLFLGLTAVFSLKAIFDNDESKIISSKGREYLSDTKKMKEINDKIEKADNDTENTHIEIVI